MATHPEMFSYFPSNVTRFKRTLIPYPSENIGQSQSGLMFFYNSARLKQKIMKYAIACTLTESCIYPNSPLTIDKPEMRRTQRTKISNKTKRKHFNQLKRTSNRKNENLRIFQKSSKMW